MRGHLRLSLETCCLIGICIADMLLTAVLLHTGVAVAANPVLAGSLQHGIASFIGVKAIFTLLPLLTLEWLRYRRGRGVQRIQQLGIAAYAFLYVLGCLSANA